MRDNQVYVADTHALAYYLADQLPEDADSIFQRAERERCSMVIPSIAVAELIYVFEQAEGGSKIWEMFDNVEMYPSFSITPLDQEVLRTVPEVKLTELHDRIIVGTAVKLEATALITKDTEITEAKMIDTIW